MTSYSTGRLKKSLVDPPPGGGGGSLVGIRLSTLLTSNLHAPTCKYCLTGGGRSSHQGVFVFLQRAWKPAEVKEEAGNAAKAADGAIDLTLDSDDSLEDAPPPWQVGIDQEKWCQLLVYQAAPRQHGGVQHRLSVVSGQANTCYEEGWWHPLRVCHITQKEHP